MQAASILGTEQAFAYYLAWAAILQGWTWTLQRRSAAGMTQMRRGLEALQATGGAVRLPYYWALLAEAAGRAGQVAEGLTFVSKALAQIASTGESWYEAALHRLKGELLARAQDQRAAALGCFQDALAVARRQDAKALELRAAMSLSRFWQQQGKHAAAYELLAPIYGWFTEGFDTADLQEAKALLDELGA